MKGTGLSLLFGEKCLMFKNTAKIIKQISLGEDSVLELKTVKFSGNKGSPKNKFTFSGVEAAAWQGARRANSRLFNRRATQPCGMDRRMKVLFLGEPLVKNDNNS